MTNIYHHSVLALRLTKIGQNLMNWSNDQFFVSFRELTAQDHGLIANEATKLLEGFPDSMWSFEKDNRSARIAQ